MEEKTFENNMTLQDTPTTTNNNNNDNNNNNNNNNNDNNEFDQKILYDIFIHQPEWYIDSTPLHSQQQEQQRKHKSSTFGHEIRQRSPAQPSAYPTADGHAEFYEVSPLVYLGYELNEMNRSTFGNIIQGEYGVLIRSGSRIFDWSKPSILHSTLSYMHFDPSPPFPSPPYQLRSSSMSAVCKFVPLW